MSIKSEIESFAPSSERELLDKSVILHCIDTFPDVLTRENRICHFTASAWIVNPGHMKALVIFHNLARQWRWPGGHTDGESDLLKVALNEAREETGLENIKALDDGVFSLEVFAIPTHLHKGKMVNSHLHLDAGFIFEASEDEEFRIKPDENSGIRWMTFAEIARAAETGQMSEFYPRLIEKTKNEYFLLHPSRTTQRTAKP